MATSPTEQHQLRSLLAALVDGAAAARLPPDDAGLVALARHHRLTPLLSAERGSELPAPLAQVFRRDRVVTAARAMLLSEAAQECIRAIAAAGVRTIVLKGLDYDTRLYGVPGARPSADVDLLVPGPARREAFRVLDRLGFEPRAAAPGFDEDDYHEVAWHRGGVEVDLHMALAPLARCRIDYGAVWADAEVLPLGATETGALARPHAAVFHALHMAIDHFAVPAIYLVDLARLLPTAAAREDARRIAEQWRCRRPLATAVALAAAFIPGWSAETPLSFAARRVVARYGGRAPLPRPEQLARKLLHFDGLTDAARYVAVQSRRNVRELAETRVLRRTPRERLRLG